MAIGNLVTDELCLEEANQTASRVELLENIERALSDRNRNSNYKENQNQTDRKSVV